MTDQLRAEMEKWEKLYHVATAAAELLLEMLESERAKSARLVEALKEIVRVSGTSTEHWHMANNALKELGDE